MIDVEKEGLYLLYACQTPHVYFKHIKPEYFDNDIIKMLYRMSKAFYDRYSVIPFKIGDNDISQIRTIVNDNPSKFVINDDMTVEENVSTFLNTVETIISLDILSYNQKWLKESYEGWLLLKNTQYSFQAAIDYISMQDINEKNVKSVVSKAKSIIISSGYDLSDTEVKPVSFKDPEAHKQIDPEKLINLGFPHLNEWLSGDKNGGTEPGTLSIFVGESNIGKSIWLSNIAYNSMLYGHNVLLVSLEMSEEKIIKRIGSNAFDIAIDDYRKMDSTEYAKHKIEKWNMECMNNMLTPGELYVVKFGAATVNDIRASIISLEARLGIKFELLVLDYLTELSNQHGISPENMYMFHKSNVNDLFAMSKDLDIATVTAHQIKGDDYGAEDLTLSSLGESRGIIHRPDNIIGIIQPPQMKLEGLYNLKNLKTRDSKFKNYKIEYKIDYQKMRLIEQKLMEPAEITF